MALGNHVRKRATAEKLSLRVRATDHKSKDVIDTDKEANFNKPLVRQEQTRVCRGTMMAAESLVQKERMLVFGMPKMVGCYKRLLALVRQ